MRTLLTICVLVGLTAGCSETKAQPEKPFEATWESLKKHTDPEWFADAKFGLYTHWGPVTVGSEDATEGNVQWYGMAMYDPNDLAFEFHRTKFGDQNEVGYKDLIPLFTAEKFDAEAWAELFAASGARFAGPVVIHHDNFAMWDSEVTKWNSQDMGPGRDFTAELAAAIRKRDMKFIATFHHAFAWRYFEPSYQFDGADPNYAALYCEAHEEGAPPTKNYLDLWLAMTNEVVEKYRPDLIWFDFGLGDVEQNCITPEYQQRMFADYYNWGAQNDLEVAVAHKHWDIHENTGIIDFERGRLDYLPEFPWLTDTSVGPWFNQKSEPFRSANELVDVLIDIVSKNGCMLLNVGPTIKGEIPPEADEILRGIGKWLDTNGEAIFDTRPWLVHGEGPTEQTTSGRFSEDSDEGFTNKDIRYTQSKDGKILYAIVLDPPDGEVTLTLLNITGQEDDAKVELLGYDGEVELELNESNQPVLRIVTEGEIQELGEHAFAFKLVGFDVQKSE